MDVWLYSGTQHSRCVPPCHWNNALKAPNRLRKNNISRLSSMSSPSDLPSFPPPSVRPSKCTGIAATATAAYLFIYFSFSGALYAKICFRKVLRSLWSAVTSWNDSISRVASGFRFFLSLLLLSGEGSRSLAGSSGRYVNYTSHRPILLQSGLFQLVFQYSVVQSPSKLLQLKIVCNWKLFVVENCLQFFT